MERVESSPQAATQRSGISSDDVGPDPLVRPFPWGPLLLPVLCSRNHPSIDNPPNHSHLGTLELFGGTQFVNQADVGGVYNGQWIMDTSRWVTKAYKPSTPLPRTGY